MSSIAANIKRISEEIDNIAKNCGRDPQHISLMAVSKTKPMAMLTDAYEAGMRLFGENRVAEAVEKREILPEDGKIHLIGHLQSNKVKVSVGKFSCIDSVDSLKLARKINSQAATLGIVQDILLEIKTDEVEAKSGFQNDDEYFSVLNDIILMSNIRVCGLMTIAPFTDNEDLVRNAFRKCKNLFELSKPILSSDSFEVLSMGMSGDFPIAIEEGSTLVRVGSSIFGARL